MNYKRIISLILSLALVFTTVTVIPVVAEENTETDTETVTEIVTKKDTHTVTGTSESSDRYATNVIIDETFEKYNHDQIMPVPIINGKEANIWSQGGKDEWNGVTGVRIISEDVTGNKIGKFYSDEGGSVGLTYAEDVGSTDPYNLLIKARIRPMEGTSTMAIQNYSAPKQTITYFSASAGTLKCFGRTVGSIDMNQWHDVEFHFDYKNNRGSVYINGALVAEEENMITKTDDVKTNVYGNFGYIVMGFKSNVSAGGCAYWDDIYVRELGVCDPETGKEIGNNLANLEGVHPRLFATANDFENMKRLAACELSEEYEAFLKNADKLADTPPTEYYRATSREELWMEDVGYTIMKLSLAYKLTGEEKYKTAARNWAMMGISYPQWGRKYDDGTDGGPYNCDLAAAHMFVGIACFYDWLYDEIDPADKTAIINCFIERGPYIYKGSWYNSNYLQNHLWISRAGLYAAAATLYDIYEPAVEWFGRADVSYKQIFKYLGAESGDGSSHEGFGYYLFGLTFVAFYLDIAENFMNIDYYSDHAHLKNAYKYITNIAMPGQYENGDLTVWSYGDATMYQNVMVIADLAQLAHITKSGENQWLVNFIRDHVNDSAGNSALWRLLLWYDESVKEVPFEEQNRTNDELLDHLGFFFSRTGWTDDASLVAYRCGALFGEDAAADPPKYSLGTGHNHGDINAPWIWTRGENLIYESGYGNKESDAHSTLLVNGKGQVITQPATEMVAKILKIDTQDNLTYSVGDGTAVYDPLTTGLKKFQRHFIYLKPDILIMLDDIETDTELTTADDTEIPLTLKFFPQATSYTPETNGSYSFEGKNTSFNIYPADLEDGVVSACGSVSKGNTTGVGVTISSNNSRLVQPTIISWNDKDKSPVKVDVIRKNDSKIFEFYTNRDKIVLDVENMEVTHEIIKTGDTAIKLDGALVSGDYLATLGSDYRFYMEADEIAEVFGITADIDENTVTFSNKTKKTVMTVGSNTVNMNGKEMTMDAVPYIVGDNIMVPVRYAGQGFGIGVDYLESDKVLAFKSNTDFSIADLKSFAVNGIGMQAKDGVYDYEIKCFGYDAEISALAKDSSTKIEIINGGIDGTSVIKTTSADETNSKTYNIKVSSIHGIGNVGIAKMTYSESDGNVGENAFDCDVQTRWAANGIGQWLFMDLGKKVKLDHMLVAYTNGAKRKEYFDIQVSEDAENWTTIGQFNSSGTTTDAEVYPMNVETRYVRFWSRGQGQGGWTSVGEIGLVRAE